MAGQLLLLGMVAFLSASTVNAVIAGVFRARPALPAATAPSDATAPTKHPIAYYAPILDRDIFNPQRAAEPEPVAQVPDLKAKLIGTAPGTGIDSFAIIEDQNAKNQELYRIGDKVQNRTLTKVEWDRVTLKIGAREEVLKIVEPNAKPGTAPAPVVSNTGIEKQGDNEFVVERAEVDKAMENLNQLFTQIRAVPHFQDGKASGFRLFAIRQDSIFEKIGLKNGDIISRINGNELTDPARAMSMIQELRNEGQITVDLTRDRQPTSLTYEIR
ncbi:MAG: type II secretion system protein GspC [Candidatus Binatia bacterium]